MLRTNRSCPGTSTKPSEARARRSVGEAEIDGDAAGLLPAAIGRPYAGESFTSAVLPWSTWPAMPMTPRTIISVMAKGQREILAEIITGEGRSLAGGRRHAVHEPRIFTGDPGDDEFHGSIFPLFAIGLSGWVIGLPSLCSISNKEQTRAHRFPTMVPSSGLGIDAHHCTVHLRVPRTRRFAAARHAAAVPRRAPCRRGSNEEWPRAAE